MAYPLDQRVRGSMFTNPKLNVVRTTDGKSIEVLESTGVRYEDEHGAVLINGQMLNVSGGYMLYRHSMKTVSAPPNTELSDARRAHILDTVRAAMTFQGLPVTIF